LILKITYTRAKSPQFIYRDALAGLKARYPALKSRATPPLP
jgi:hypothetical protein